MKIIRKGDKILVDKGILGSDKGIFIKNTGYSAFGFFGIYKSDKDNKEHNFDQFVHSIKKL